jgi:hypothetical protein
VPGRLWRDGGYRSNRIPWHRSRARSKRRRCRFRLLGHSLLYTPAAPDSNRKAGTRRKPENLGPTWNAVLQR